MLASATSTVSALGNAYLQQAQAPTLSSDQAKTHAFAAHPAAPTRLLPGTSGTEAAGTPQPSLAALRLATRAIEQAVRAQASALSFNIAQSAGTTVVQVTDDATGKILRQIPSEEMLSLPQALNSVQGLLLSQYA